MSTLTRWRGRGRLYEWRQKDEQVRQESKCQWGNRLAPSGAILQKHTILFLLASLGLASSTFSVKLSGLDSAGTTGAQQAGWMWQGECGRPRVNEPGSDKSAVNESEKNKRTKRTWEHSLNMVRGIGNNQNIKYLQEIRLGILTSRGWPGTRYRSRSIDKWAPCVSPWLRKSF